MRQCLKTLELVLLHFGCLQQSKLDHLPLLIYYLLPFLHQSPHCLGLKWTQTPRNDLVCYLLSLSIPQKNPHHSAEMYLGCCCFPFLLVSVLASPSVLGLVSAFGRASGRASVSGQVLDLASAFDLVSAQVLTSDLVWDLASAFGQALGRVLTSGLVWDLVSAFGQASVLVLAFDLVLALVSILVLAWDLVSISAPAWDLALIYVRA
mmetsp:Transcript_17186/g.23880  ORF Transcript_17186/g.23880 Transcript_17186/m.23880 type:complete len:207 (+) Transcript_17186:1015-1635(+)